MKLTPNFNASVLCATYIVFILYCIVDFFAFEVKTFVKYSFFSPIHSAFFVIYIIDSHHRVTSIYTGKWSDNGSKKDSVNLKNLLTLVLPAFFIKIKSIASLCSFGE